MRAALLLAAFTAAILPAAAAELRGHGGPVRALALMPDGETLISGSFDTAVILWSLARAAAQAVLQFHSDSVNAVAALPNGRFASAGADGRIALWRMGGSKPERVLEGHTAPIVALDVSKDGTRLASASWDGTARIWPLAGGEARVLTGHQGNVNGVAFLPDGGIATAGYDATLRVWADGEAAPRVVTLPTPLNTLAALPDGRLAVGGGDGRLRLVAPDGTVSEGVEITQTPVTTIGVSQDGKRIAAAGIRGAIAVIDTKTMTIERTLVGPGMPIWSLVFLLGGKEILTGGSDRVIRRWNVETGETVGPVVAGALPDPLAAYAGDPGAEVFRACVACHTLRPGQGPRAGPSLHGVMGRRIGTLPGYNYSDEFRELDIVWTKETIAKLFELGPHTYTPGTKMPEQKVIRPEDRKALVEFIAKATK
jgi:cytochrome c